MSTPSTPHSSGPSPRRPDRRVLRPWLLQVLMIAAAISPARAADDVAALRFVHLSPDTPLVDVLVSGALTVRDLAFLQRSSVAVVPAGSHEIRVFPHRLPRRTAADGEAEAPTTRAATPLEPVVAIVELTAGSVTTVALTGSYEPPVQEGGRGHLSLQVEPPDAEIALSGPRGYRALLEGDQFVTDLEPGPYRADVTRSGFVAAAYETEIAAGVTSIVTITLQEADDGEAPSEVRVTPSERQATWRGLELQPYRSEVVPTAPVGHALVRFVHVSPTVPDLDIYARPTVDEEGEQGDVGDDGGTDPDRRPVTVTGLGYPNDSAYQVLSMHRYDLQLRVAGTASVIHEVSSLTFAPGATYTVFVSADPLDNQVWLVPHVDALVVQHLPPVEAP
jgi:hypothetical protein